MVVYTVAQPPKASIFESELARCTKMLCDGGGKSQADGGIV